MDLSNHQYFKPEAKRYYYAALYTHERQPLLSNDAAKQTFLAALAETKDEFRLAVTAYAILDDQVQLIYATAALQESSAVLNHLRGAFLRLHRQINPDLARTPIWSHSAEVRRLSDKHALRSHLDFIHYAPVWKKLVTRASDYAWSSLPARIAQGHFSAAWATLAPPAAIARLDLPFTSKQI